MRKHLLILFLMLALGAGSLHAQWLKRYRDFLFKPDAKAQNYAGMLSYQYMYSPWSEPIKIQGMQFGFGLNLARLFSKKFILGASFDLKGFKGFTGQNIPPDFTVDFNAAMHPSFSSLEDTIKAYMLRDAINGVPGKSFVGNYTSNIGLMFSLFPQRYGGILLQFKSGFRTIPINGAYDYNQMIQSDSDYSDWVLNRNYVGELTMKPFAFFRNTYSLANDHDSFFNHVLVTVYYERINLRGSTVAGMRIEDIVDHSFVDKYASFSRFGFKLGIGIY